MLKKLSGKWQGTAIKTICKGRGQNERQIATYYTADAEIEIDRQGAKILQFLFKSENYDKKTKSGREEQFLLALANSKLSVFGLGKENLELIESNSTTLDLRKRYMYHIPTGGLRRGELMYKLHYDNGTLSISDTRYINNKFAVKIVWSLRKTH